MINKVYNYLEFLLEGNTPEDYIRQCFQNIENKIKQAFNQESDDKVKKMSDFSKFNLKLDDLTPHMNSFSRKNLTVKFSDNEENVYVLNIAMNVEDAVNQNKDQDYNVSDIKKAHVTFKKYNDKTGNVEIENQLLDRTVDPEVIDGDFLIKLKMDLDKGVEPSEEEFKIETDDNKPEEESQKAQVKPESQQKAQSDTDAPKETPQETI